jgi:RNA polymerase sigma factor (sigma-70 family)
MTVADCEPRNEDGGPDDLENAAMVFGQVQVRLFGIAYRGLRSASEAEDLVQDVWLRWQTCDRGAVVNPAAYLSTAVTRLAINAVQSARVRRETYVSPWLLETVDTCKDPHLGAERGEALEFAVRLMLERLSPGERAAYILREAFDYPYERIADIIRLSEAAARQLVSRARKHVLADRRAEVPPAERRRLLDAFVAAAQTGDLAGLEEILAADMAVSAEDGGVVRASRTPGTAVRRAPRTPALSRAVSGPGARSGGRIQAAGSPHCSAGFP